MQPERALRLLDSLDGAAYAARLACAGYWGARLRFACFAAACSCVALLARLPLV